MSSPSFLWPSTQPGSPNSPYYNEPDDLSSLSPPLDCDLPKARDWNLAVSVFQASSTMPEIYCRHLMSWKNACIIIFPEFLVSIHPKNVINLNSPATLNADLNHKMCANCTDIKVWAKGASWDQGLIRIEDRQQQHTNWEVRDRLQKERTEQTASVKSVSYQQDRKATEKTSALVTIPNTTVSPKTSCFITDLHSEIGI